MLKVVKSNPVVEEKIETDQYIPINIKWTKTYDRYEGVIYWRTGDIKRSMLEIGVSEISGEVQSLTIVTADKISFVSEGIEKCKKFENGTPVFDISNWAGKRTVDDIGLFEVQYCDKCLDMIISENKVNKEIVSGRVSFGLDTDMNVCRISVNNLSDDEKFQIKDTLEYMIKSC